MDLMDYRRKIIANSPHLESASGAIASFSDGADLPLKSLNVDIDPVQSGTGDPSPSNVRPISGWSAVKVTRTGKNLLNPNYELLNAYISGNGALTANPNNRTMILPCKPDTTYTWTWTRSAITSSNDDSAVVSFSAKPNTGDIGTYLLRYSTTSGEGRSFTTGTDAQWLAIKIGNTTNTDAVATINASMLELGSIATSYEPYQGQSVTVQLGQTVYGGTLNPLTGVLTVDRQFFELDGNSDVTKGSSGSASASEAFPYWATIYIPCNNATTNYSAWRFSHGKCQSAAYSGIFRTYKTNNTTIQATVGTDALLSTTADAKTWLQAQKDNGTPLQIVAELTEPITIQLTPQQIRTLYGNSTIFADTGNVALEYWAHH